MTKTADFNTNNIRSPKYYIKWILKSLGIALAVLLGIILLMGAFPVSYQGLNSEPHPANSYAEAFGRYEELERAETGIVNPESGSRLLTHGRKTPRVYVLIHGITNSPFQWLEFGEMMYEQGNNVLIVRMPYHGLKSHRVSELKPITPQDLRLYADEIVDIAAGLGDEVFVAGISGGGVVAAWIAQNRPEIDRSFLLSPFTGIGEIPDFLSALLMNAFSRLPSMDTFDKAENVRSYAYPGETTRAVSAFLALSHFVRMEASEGGLPYGKVYIQTTALDTAVNNKSTTILYNLWKALGADVSINQFDASLGIPHNSVDPAEPLAIREEIYKKMLDFFGAQNQVQ